MNKSELISFWKENREIIASFIRKRLNKPDDTNDILQEVFIKCWANYGSIKDQDKLLSWIFGVSKFTIADYYRVKKRNEFKFNSSLFSVNTENEIEKQTTDESKKLLPLIYSLPLKYKNVLLLSEIIGLQHKVISDQLCLSVSCVKTRVIRARKLLEKKMMECCSFSHDVYGNIVNCHEKPAYSECLKIYKG